jgi:hypothetical protein
MIKMGQTGIELVPVLPYVPRGVSHQAAPKMREEALLHWR